MLNVFFNPADAIEDAKKYGEWVITIAALAISAVLIAVIPMIVMKSFIWKISLMTLGGLIVVPFVGALFLKVALGILGAKNPGYQDCMNSIVYAMAPLSVVVLASSLLMMVPYAGTYLAVAVGGFGIMVALATNLKAIVELAETELLTAIAAMWATVTAVILAWYAIIVISAISKFAEMIAAMSTNTTVVL